jgi:general secretion pathway protein B
MSILLDALKKSETQRQLGKTPTIHTAVEAPDAAKATEQQWIPLSMLALSAVAIAWFGWQQFREPEATLVQAGVDVVEVPQVVETPAVETPVVETPAVETPAVETPVVKTQAPAENADPGSMKPAAGASLRNEKKDLADSTALPANSPEETRERREKLSQSFNSYAAEKDTASDTAAELSPATVAEPSSDPPTNQPRIAEEAPVATPARRSSRLQPHESEPISFWQIPQALRDGLPEFRINVLVYAEKQEDRFLLINGQRLVEKEELTDGVVLDEIRRDGAVFLYRNYRFLVKS